MNEIVNKFLLAGDKFLPEMHLKQPRFIIVHTNHLLKTKKEIIQNIKETGDTSYIYKKELDKAYFQHDMAYGDFKDLKRRTDSHKLMLNHLLKYNMWKNNNHFLTNSSFLLKFSKDVFQACLCSLSSHV